MDEYIDELLERRAPLREPLADEPDDDGLELRALATRVPRGGPWADHRPARVH